MERVAFCPGYARGLAVVDHYAVVGLTEEALAAVTDEAIRQLTLGLGPTAAARLTGVRFELADLPGAILGQASGNTIRLDRDAAGYGWFVDPTPGDDAEFAWDVAADELRAARRSPAVDRADLLTAVLHELGHVLGCDHSDEWGTMQEALEPGTRRLWESHL